MDITWDVQYKVQYKDGIVHPPVPLSMAMLLTADQLHMMGGMFNSGMCLNGGTGPSFFHFPTCCLQCGYECAGVSYWSVWVSAIS